MSKSMRLGASALGAIVVCAGILSGSSSLAAPSSVPKSDGKEAKCDPGYNPCLSGGCCPAAQSHTCAKISTCHDSIEGAVAAGCSRAEVDVCVAPAK